MGIVLIPPRSAAALALLLQLAPVYAAIGTIDSLDGDVRVIAGGVERRGHFGLAIKEGDTIKTGANAWAFFAMSDGASMTLRPNTQLRFDIYRYHPHGDVTQNRCLMSLVKGAFRSVTGVIGQVNRANYQITTPTVQIGIRGTDHEPAYYPPPGPGEVLDFRPGVYDKVNAGESFLRNAKGAIGIKPGQIGFAREGGRSRPQLLRSTPAFYQRHAELDRKIAARRQELHRLFEAEVRLRHQEPTPIQSHSTVRALGQRLDFPWLHAARLLVL